MQKSTRGLTLRRLRPIVFIVMLCGLIGTATARAAAPIPVPVEHFFDNAAFTGAVLSPTAKFLAARLGRPGQRDALVVVDLTDKTVKVVASFPRDDIGNFYWVNDERLVFDATDKTAGQGDVRYYPGLYAVDRDGGNQRQLVQRETLGDVTERTMVKMLPGATFLLPPTGPRTTSYVYVMSPRYDSGNQLESLNLLQLDTITGRTTPVMRPAEAKSWLLDASGEPRMIISIDKNIGALHYRDPATSQWRKLSTFDAYLGSKGAFSPVGFAPDGTLYVTSRSGGDKEALYRFDLVTGKQVTSALVELEDYDLDGDLVIGDGKLLGVRVLTDARSTVWFDAGMQALQKRIDALLPGTVNIVSVAQRAETKWVLVRSYSDVQPSVYSLFDTEAGQFNHIGSTRPAIKAAQMGQQEALRYKARDGLDIPGLLTLPHGSNRKNLPMVVLVHGGPWVRGSEWGWEPQAQFLASRGYAVLEPEFRGSTGFGARHFRAGWKQWGLAMQNDIADGARWAIAQGIADPKRICIAGASYGGYATLMGLINDPELFKCGISWVGVTDINLLYSGHWSFTSDTSDGLKRYGMPDTIGDPVKDAVQLKATSPIHQAARLKQPVLLAYGGSDRRVPTYHGRQFHDAVKQTNPQVEMVVYDEEGHGWALPKNRIDFWSRVEKFLDQHIGTR
jgi:dipeptidyl aminopeptidase/acylaminoacyl peptidase